jgi:glyoxylase-like metal-dependent hydrolase (beta-lactamase superfamily II)
VSSRVRERPDGRGDPHASNATYATRWLGRTPVVGTVAGVAAVVVHPLAGAAGLFVTVSLLFEAVGDLVDERVAAARGSDGDDGDPPAVGGDDRRPPPIRSLRPAASSLLTPRRPPAAMDDAPDGVGEAGAADGPGGPEGPVREGDGIRVARVPVPVGTRAPGGETNAYVAGGLVVDPAARHPDLDAATAGATDVAVTHAHPDHVGAVVEYAERAGATVHALAGHVERFAAATGREPDRTFEDGDRVGPARILATPGHAPDHVAFAVPTATGPVALCGDVAVAEGSVAVAAPEGDLAAYLASLDRLRRAGFARLYPGHGPPVDDPAATLAGLREHRLDRERRVLDAVAAGAREVDAVLDAAYRTDLAGVRDLARATVVAHLEKLDAEGRLRYDAGRERVTAAAPRSNEDGDGDVPDDTS